MLRAWVVKTRSMVFFRPILSERMPPPTRPEALLMASRETRIAELTMPACLVAMEARWPIIMTPADEDRTNMIQSR